MVIPSRDDTPLQWCDNSLHYDSFIMYGNVNNWQIKLLMRQVKQGYYFGRFPHKIISNKDSLAEIK